MQVTLVPYQPPLEALAACVHSSGELKITSGKVLTANGAPASTNGKLNVDGTVEGDVHAASRDSGGTVAGTETVPAPEKSLPDAGVFEMYKSMATAIPYSGDFNEHVLAPGANTYGGGLNADGLYYIDAGDKDLKIKGTRILGTLVVDAKKVTLDDAALLENYRSDYPVLIVNGNLELMLKTDELGLDEFAWTTNFNPAGAPYGGATDSDQADTYPNEIRGLVHAIGETTVKETTRVRGVVISENKVAFKGANEIVHNPDLYENPPLGYAEQAGMRISPGTWCQVVD